MEGSSLTPEACGALSAGKIAYPHSFSTAQMKCLEAIFDTFIPSISCEEAFIDPLQENSEAWGKRKEDELQAFYELSASEAGIPSYGAGLMHSKMKPNFLRVASWVLWLLSSRVGTYLLCGRASLSGKAPYLRSFTEIPLPEREKLLLTAWSHSPYLFFRTVFNAFKIYTVYSYYTKVDKNGHNLAWNAIGYSGPDPAAIEHRRKAEKATRLRPLEGRVFDAELLKENLPLKLEEAGFEVLKDVSHLASLWNFKGSDMKAKKLGVKCDVVVVGSGSGGGVVAGVLAKAGYKVLVVEKGKYFARDDLSLLEGAALDKMYEGGGILATDNSNVLILAGSTVGGGSAINWSASFKTPAHVLQEWVQDHGLTMFGDGQYEAAMQAVSARLAVQSDPGEENWQNGILRRGCEKLGFHVADAPRNNVADHSCGWCGFGCWSGKKQATSETWLVDAAANGAAIVTGVAAQAVLQRNATKGKKRQAVGLVASVDGGAPLLFIESRITVVSCGSLNTPGLLQQSGLQNPNIGKNLHLHPVQMMWGYFPEARPNQTAYEGAIITAVSTEVANWRPRGHGCILECPSLHPGIFSVLTPWLSAKDFKDRMHRFSRTVHVFALARDRGSGIVGSSQAGSMLHYPLHPLDHESLLDGGEAALRVLVAAGASEIGTHHRHGDRLVITQDTSAADVEEFLRCVRARGIEQLGTPLCSAHQMGSCRMGMDSFSSVVGPTGETWDVADLFVADASVFPTAVGINPMVTIQSIAYCIAHAVMRAVDQS